MFRNKHPIEAWDFRPIISRNSNYFPRAQFSRRDRTHLHCCAQAFTLAQIKINKPIIGRAERRLRRFELTPRREYQFNPAGFPDRRTSVPVPFSMQSPTRSKMAEQIPYVGALASFVAFPSSPPRPRGSETTWKTHVAQATLQLTPSAISLHLTLLIGLASLVLVGRIYQ